MRRLAYWAVLGLFAARACGSAHAAMTLVEQLLGNDSNITKPIGVFMRPNWGGGLMYLEVRRQPALPTRWTFELDWGDGTVLIVDQSHAHNWMVGRPEADRILLGIPIAPSRTARVTADGSGIEVLLASIWIRPPDSPQVFFPNGSASPKLEMFDRDVDPKVRAMGTGVAWLTMYSGTSPRSCTAFRVAQSYWLTALHCVAIDPSEQHPIFDGWKINPYDFVDQGTVRAPLIAKPIVTGQVNGTPDPSAVIGPRDKDYALLRADEDPGGPRFSLSESAPAKGALQMFEHYTGGVSNNPEPGKARSADARCMVIPAPAGPPLVAHPETCPGEIRHTCSGDGGASGSPLLTRSDLRLVGLHWGPGDPVHYNCALSAKSIKEDLCRWNPSLGHDLGAC